MSALGSPVQAYDFLLKFLLVGDSDVGKGEILASLQDGAAESPTATRRVSAGPEEESEALARAGARARRGRGPWAGLGALTPREHVEGVEAAEGSGAPTSENTEARGARSLRLDLAGAARTALDAPPVPLLASPWMADDLCGGGSSRELCRGGRSGSSCQEDVLTVSNVCSRDMSGQGRFCTIFSSYSRERTGNSRAGAAPPGALLGQSERSRLLQKSARSGVILVYDIANRWSFDGIAQWIKEIDEHAPGVPRILVGNRLHLAFKRQGPREQAQAYAERLGVTFFEVSPLCNFNVRESFTELARIVLLRHGVDRLWRPRKGRGQAQDASVEAFPRPPARHVPEG
ncbi:Ras-related protein Rab-40B [Tupaia chinensis]|uniref:small monomeric GTPase n=1 Tax=Tupaia chinensis TaxID=246437 RepID=L9KYZ0_TUPCH|nr:Ras-related protein Rab-40B [Tupaia chinensis]